MLFLMDNFCAFRFIHQPFNVKRPVRSGTHDILVYFRIYGAYIPCIVVYIHHVVNSLVCSYWEITNVAKGKYKVYHVVQNCHERAEYSVWTPFGIE